MKTNRLKSIKEVHNALHFHLCIKLSVLICYMSDIPLFEESFTPVILYTLIIAHVVLQQQYYILVNADDLIQIKIVQGHGQPKFRMSVLKSI